MPATRARTRKIMHDEDTRQRIQAALIINRFHDCLDGKVELSAQQVTCGKTLLAKVLPDLQAVAHEGEVGVNLWQSLLDAIDGRSKAVPETD